MSSRRPKIVTDLMLQKQATCPHWNWFDMHGDRRRCADESPWHRLMFEQRLIDEEKVVAARGPFEKPKGRTPAARAKATLALMEAGAERIYKPVLAVADLLAEPDILERRDGVPSSLGGWSYAPLDVRGGERVNEAMKIRPAFYGGLLGELQGVEPTEGGFLSIDGTVLSIPLAEHAGRVESLLAEIDEAVEGKCPPPHLAAACKQSPWFKECIRLAEAEGDIALLYNVKRRTVGKLRDLGLNSVTDVAAMDPAKFAGPSPDMSEESLERIRLQARALLEKKHFHRRPYLLPTSPPAPVANSSAATAPESRDGLSDIRGPGSAEAPRNHPEAGFGLKPPSTELFFDIEADGLRGNYDYLYGFLVRDAAGIRHVRFVAEKPEEQERMWREFLRWFGQMPHDCAVYHYGDHERHSLAVLESRYGGSKSLMRFRQQMRDLNEIVKDAFVLPLYFYGLKEIGGYIGYGRKAEIASGAVSVEYYEEWLGKGERSKLDVVIEYNREDCEATMALKDWLVADQGIGEE
jgi:uncharacterized protein